MDIRCETPYGDFEWDSEKNNLNIRKHKIDFQDAVAVFSDTNAYIRHDAAHSRWEDRFKIVGIICGTRIAAVFFTERLEITRIISARIATKEEITDYEHGIPY